MQYHGAEPLEQQQFGTAGVNWVKEPNRTRTQMKDK